MGCGLSVIDDVDGGIRGQVEDQQMLRFCAEGHVSRTLSELDLHFAAVAGRCIVVG